MPSVTGEDKLDAPEIGSALARILATPPFVRSPRLSHFLRYVVGQRLAGRADAPKEIEIGVEVFGRPHGYDPRIDPVVRVQARLLRFKLHEYYETAGKDDPVRIELPKGSYSPVFSIDVPVQNLPESPVAANVQRVVNAPASESRAKPLGWVAALLAIAALIVVTISVSSWRDAVGKVWAKTLPNRPSAAQSPAAELYLKGRYYWNKRTPADLEKAVDYFSQSIVADPGYARAYVGLADCYGLLREFSAMPDTEAWPRALAAARKAVELDDSLAEAHSSLGFDLFYGALDLKGGEREFKRAVELDPHYVEAHHWYATALMSLGRLTEAADEIRRARELQPSSRSILADQALIEFNQGKTTEAIEQLRQLETAEPSFRSVHTYLAYIYFDCKDYPHYLAEWRLATEASNDRTELAVVEAAEKGYAAGGWKGMLDSRLPLQKKLASEGAYPLFMVAQTCALLGRKQEAIEYLQASYKKKELYMATLAIDRPTWSLRSEPAYKDLTRQLGVDVAY